MDSVIDDTRYVGEYRIVSVSDYITGDWNSDAWECDDPECWEPYRDGGQVRMYEQSLTVKGDLNLDLDNSTLGCVGIVVQGNLVVEGNIVNYGDGGVNLCVEGNTEANNLIASDAYINLSMAHFKYFTIADYNHGLLQIDTLKTQFMLNSDHDTRIADEYSVEVSIGGRMRTGGRVEIDIQDLAKYWDENDIFPEAFSNDTFPNGFSLEEPASHNKNFDESYYSCSISPFCHRIVNGEEQLLIDEINLYKTEYIKRKRNLNLPLDLHESIQVVWENGAAIGVSVYDNEALNTFT